MRRLILGRRTNEPVTRGAIAPVAIAAIAAGALTAAVTWALLRPAPSIPRQPSRFLLAFADAVGDQPVRSRIALSPDGRYVVYTSCHQREPAPAVS